MAKQANTTATFLAREGRETAGSWLRRNRVAKGWGVREAAERYAVSSPYLSQLEGDRRPALEPFLRQVATAWGASPSAVCAEAGVLVGVAERFLRENPQALSLVHQWADEWLAGGASPLASLRKVVAGTVESAS
jgi:transcriptional regulator with XRE-family HTH domain